MLKVLNKAYKAGDLEFIRNKGQEPCFYRVKLNGSVQVAIVTHTFIKGDHVWHVTSNNSNETSKWLIKRITELYYE